MPGVSVTIPVSGVATIGKTSLFLQHLSAKSPGQGTAAAFIGEAGQLTRNRPKCIKNRNLSWYHQWVCAERRQHKRLNLRPVILARSPTLVAVVAWSVFGGAVALVIKRSFGTSACRHSMHTTWFCIVWDCMSCQLATVNESELPFTADAAYS